MLAIILPPENSNLIIENKPSIIVTTNEHSGTDLQTKYATITNATIIPIDLSLSTIIYIILFIIFCLFAIYLHLIYI